MADPRLGSGTMSCCGTYVRMSEVKVSPTQRSADNHRIDIVQCPNVHCWTRTGVDPGPAARLNAALRRAGLT